MVQKFYQKVKSYGLEFASVDTCCINKSSGAGLNKSLWSMFRTFDGTRTLVSAPYILRRRNALSREDEVLQQELGSVEGSC
jgi:hypothetical protein